MNIRYQSLVDLYKVDPAKARCARQFILDARKAAMNGEFYKFIYFPPNILETLLPVSRRWSSCKPGKEFLLYLLLAVTGDPKWKFSGSGTICTFCELPLGDYCVPIYNITYDCGTVTKCQASACIMCKAFMIQKPPCGSCENCNDEIPI